MNKAFTLAILVAASLMTAATAHAAPPPTPGVAFVNQAAFFSRFDPTTSNAAYLGGPLTGNQLNVRVTSSNYKYVTFEEPTTLMIPGPTVTVEKIVFEVLPELYFELFPETVPDFPNYQDCDYGLGTTTCQVPGACTVAVVTRLGPDTIVLRQDPAALATLDGGPCRVTINSQLGHDVIDSRDGTSTTVICGGGNDRVLADAGDRVASDCEIVTRS